MIQEYLPFDEFILENPVRNRSSRVFEGVAFSTVIKPKFYAGVSSEPEITEEIIKAVSTAGTKFPVTVVYDSTGGRYPFLAYPASLPVKEFAQIGAFQYNDLITTEVELTDAAGVKILYRVLRFNGIQNGSYIEVTW